MSSIRYFDSTLRDGSHAINHQFSVEEVINYCKAIDEVGIDLVIVGHGNGLAASSILIGESLHSDEELLIAARNHLKKTKLGVLVIPGIATLDHIQQAIDLGVDVFLIASHITEASVTKQYIQYVVSMGKECYGILMMIHMASTDVIVNQVKLMEQYGTKGVILMDSAGTSVTSKIREIILQINKETSIEVGIHAHNNLGLAASNTLVAIESGATIVDATVRGLGAGAGNTQLEQIVAIRSMLGIDDNVDFERLLIISDSIVAGFKPTHTGTDGLSIQSAVSGVFSGFKPKVLLASKEFNVSPYRLFYELGKLKVVAGQEDKIREVAYILSELESN